MTYAVARRYKVSEPELDLCAHMFSDDLVKKVTGRSGFASIRISFKGFRF